VYWAVAQKYIEKDNTQNAPKDGRTDIKSGNMLVMIVNIVCICNITNDTNI